jgi:phosphoribosylamine-glycine ligase
MSKEGAPFVGLLYPGLMLTKDGPKILEYNVRFGDPETQTYMRLLDSDIVEIFLACIEGRLSMQDIKWKSGFACTIVLASGGYPGSYEKGKEIMGIGDAELDPDIVIFHAGTLNKESTIVTNGGRVLGISATGETLEVALEKAYKAVAKISFEGMQYRRDIGQKTLQLQK